MSNDVENKKIVLMVDDDEIHLLTAELCLKDDYEVFKSKSGDEALKLLIKDKIIPDIILLDIIMPEMDGWDVFGKIKGISILKNVPILFLTSANGEAERRKARDIGAVDYITKPFNMDLLKSTIKKILEVKGKDKKW